MKSYIHLIRHGITEGIEKKWFYGAMDIPVLPSGFEEIRRNLEAGIYPEIPEDANIYTTPLFRTEQTLKAIYGDRRHTVIQNLRELNFGDWEGRTAEELGSLTAWYEWMEDRSGKFRFPGGGETALEFYERVCLGFKEAEGLHRLKELAHRHDGMDAVSLIVCHGGPISVIMETLFPGEREHFMQWTPGTSRGYTLVYENGSASEYKII